MSAYEAIRCGVSRFDTSPRLVARRSESAGGNLPTEDLVHLSIELATGINLDRLLDAVALLREIVGHDLPGRVARPTGRVPARDALASQSRTRRVAASSAMSRMMSASRKSFGV